MKILIETGKKDQLEKRIDELLSKMSGGKTLTKLEFRELDILTQAESFLNKHLC